VTEQLTLLGGVTVVELTERQQHALEAIEAADGGLASDELGAVMHERRGKHDRGSRCDWCQQEGQGVAGELRKKGLLVRRRSGMWQSLRPLESRDGTIGAGPSLDSSGAGVGNSAGSGSAPVRVNPSARTLDPDTSHQAAATVTALNDKQQAVLDVFHTYGPLTDEDLENAYDVTGGPQQSESGLRTRRHELVEQGLIRDSGRREPSSAGRQSIVWEPVEAATTSDPWNAGAGEIPF
jgi:hypothetical protein